MNILHRLRTVISMDAPDVATIARISTGLTASSNNVWAIHGMRVLLTSGAAGLDPLTTFGSWLLGMDTDGGPTYNGPYALAAGNSAATTAMAAGAGPNVAWPLDSLILPPLGAVIVWREEFGLRLETASYAVPEVAEVDLYYSIEKITPNYKISLLNGLAQ